MTRLDRLGEAALIKSLLPHLAHDGLVIGPGADDAAVWSEPGGGFTVASCDASVEGVEFADVPLERRRPDSGHRGRGWTRGR